MAFREFDQGALSRRALLRGGAFLAGASGLASLPLSRALALHDVGEAWPHLEALADKYVSSSKLANLLITLGSGQQEHAHTVGGGKLGFSSLQEVDQDSLFRIYSMTKPITGMATMMCIDDGLIGLDQPLGEILPAFAEMQVLKDPKGPLEETVPAEGPMTVRQLLTHTAGLSYGFSRDDTLAAEYNKRGVSAGQISKFPIPGMPSYESVKGLEEWANTLAELPLAYQPGTLWSYSASTDLLGRVIEVASGKGFDQFLQERLFDPCGMDSTFWQVPESEVGRFTDNYGILNEVPLPVDPAADSIFSDTPPVFWGGSGLVSSPRDYDRFQRMLLGYGTLDGQKVMNEAAVKLGTSNLLPETAKIEGTWVAGQGFGAGGRSVDGTFGWGGAAGTLSSIDYGLDMRMCLFTQYMPSDSYPIRDEFLEAITKDTAALKAM